MGWRPQTSLSQGLNDPSRTIRDSKRRARDRAALPHRPVVLAGGSAHGSRACSQDPKVLAPIGDSTFSIYCSNGWTPPAFARRALPRSFRRRRAQPS